MIWAALAILFSSMFGDSAHFGILRIDHLRDRAKHIIEDDARLEQVNHIIDTAAAADRRFARDSLAASADLFRLHADQTAQTEALAAVFEKLEANRHVAINAVLDARFALRQVLTEDEWQAMFVEGAAAAR